MSARDKRCVQCGGEIEADEIGGECWSCARETVVGLLLIFGVAASLVVSLVLVSS